jgi:phenylpropionate dioxygenase-like ring-hydroxylating dioxygenase large terminal subunit
MAKHTTPNPKAKQPPRRGRRIAPQGEGGYDVCWYAIGKSEDVRPGEVARMKFLDGHLAVWRGMNGRLAVHSPFCRHMGADLTVRGTVVGDRLRCPFHHWAYDQAGAVAEIPSGDPIPKRTCLFTFPVVERYGVIWIFNGDTPLYEPPALAIPERDAVWRVFGPIDIDLDPGLQMANQLDFQHLRVLHGLQIDSYPEVVFEKYCMVTRGTRMRDPKRGWNEPIEVDGKLFGTSVLTFGGIFDGVETAFALGSTPQPDIRSRAWLVSATRKGVLPEEVARNALAGLEKWSLALIIDDDNDIMNHASFRFDALTRSDAYVAKYSRFLEKYPRAHPARDFIT